MDPRLILAILAGKLITLILKLFGSGATAAPGLYALKIDPFLIKKLSKKITNGSIVISGTNGKTTSSRLAYAMLSSKYKVLHNRQGSNLLRGIASTLISKSSILGNIRADLALWEVDEATLPEAILSLSPKTVILLNLFRDQLDRYGEIDTIFQKWQKSLAKLAKNSTLILNADDPQMAFLKQSFKGKTICFGLNDKTINLPAIADVADIRYCLNCGSKLEYLNLFSAHLGHFKCKNCNFVRPNPQIFAQNLNFKKNYSSSLILSIHHKRLAINYPLPGLYNVYNVLAAAAIGAELAINPKTIALNISKFKSVFGRFQKTEIKNKQVIIFLIKNPTGANEVIRILAPKKNLNILVILNDKIADGRDVSWIWDTQWESLSNKIKSISISGTRAYDMAIRLKYAQIKLNNKSVYKNISYSILKSLENLNNNDTLIILPTYSALLNVQESLSKFNKSMKWHNQ